MPGTNRYRIFGNFPPGPDGPSAEYSEPTHHEFQAMVDERVPFPPATVIKEFWVTRYRVHSRTVPRYRDGRILLVGDAAHVHSPAGAQGMNTGIQDAYNLGWKLAYVLRGSPTNHWWTATTPNAIRSASNCSRPPTGCSRSSAARIRWRAWPVAESRRCSPAKC